MIRSVFRDGAHSARVWLDGVDVTADCQIAIADEPDEAGAVLLLKRNAEGKHYLDRVRNEPAREWKYGRVVIQPCRTTNTASA